MTELTYWVNGTFVPASQAVIPINSRGYRLGDGVFDTERTFRGEIFKLEAHLKRLERSLRFTRIDPGLPLEELAEVTREVVRRNEALRERHGDYWVTQTVSRHGNPAAPGAFVSVIVDPLPFARNAPFYDQGVPLVSPSVRTAAVAGLDPKVKATSRLNMVLADLETRQADPAAWTLLMDDEGNLAEVLYGNLFVVRDGVIHTPGARAVLEGVTRDTTIQLARERGFTVQEGRLQPYDLYTADEAFITSTSYCVLPVRALNGSPIGQDVPGAVTRQLMEGWNKLAGFDVADQARSYAGGPQLHAPLREVSPR